MTGVAPDTAGATVEDGALPLLQAIEVLMPSSNTNVERVFRMIESHVWDEKELTMNESRSVEHRVRLRAHTCQR